MIAQDLAEPGMKTIPKQGPPIAVDSIYPNRLNPNEMEEVDVYQLMNDVGNDDYDPIIISPINVFYTVQARQDPRVTALIPHDADPEETYIITDGYHRHKAATQLGLSHIRSMVKHQTEADAMPHFYKRHKLRGQMDPIKEAQLFRHEMDTRKITQAQLVELYNLTTVNYIKTRLALLNVTWRVVELYYEVPEDLPGRLSIEHLRSISFVPKNMQYAVAMMSLDRNWRVEDIRAEVKRIRGGLGLRATNGSEAGPPGTYPTTIQRYLHPNIDRLLRPNEENTVRFIKNEGPVSIKQVSEMLELTEQGAGVILKKLLKMDVITSERRKKKGKGRPKQFYRIWVAKEQPKSEYVRKTPLTDEELLAQYPEALRMEPEEEATTVGERSQGSSQGPIRVGAPRPIVQGPDDRTLPQAPLMNIKPHEPAPAPEQPLELPLVLDQELIENFMERIYDMAINEGLDVKTKKPINGQDPEEWMETEIATNRREWVKLRETGRVDLLTLVAIALRACQLYTRHKEM